MTFGFGQVSHSPLPPERGLDALHLSTASQSFVADRVGHLVIGLNHHMLDYESYAKHVS
jgi:hypothetical protein